MPLDLDIGAIQYPQVDGSVIRDTDQATVDVSGHYSVAGATDQERQAELEIAMFKRGKTALANYDRQKQIDDHNKEIQKSVDPLKDSRVNQPTAPTAPSMAVATDAGKLTISGTADTATVRLDLVITGEGIAEGANFTDTLPAYSYEMDEPTVSLTITATAYNIIDDQAVKTATWTPAGELNKE